VISDEENNQLLNGSGTGTDMTGFLAVSGILTHQAGLGSTPEPPFDDFEQAIRNDAQRPG
jgi:hypothetical protein